MSGVVLEGGVCGRVCIFGRRMHDVCVRTVWRASPSCAMSLALNDRQSPKGAASSEVAPLGVNRACSCCCCRCVEPKKQGCWRDRDEACASGAARLIEAMSTQCILFKRLGPRLVALLSHVRRLCVWQDGR